VAPLAEQAGVTLVLELLNSKKDHPDYQADHTAWGVRVCEAVGSPAVKLLYDIYHMQIMEGDVISCIQQNHQWLAHYHTAGVPGRHDLDQEQELYYPAICRAIVATGYDGFLGHEFVPKGEPIAALEAAYKTCDVSG
jgi:hydroxypyruvate isomerase